MAIKGAVLGDILVCGLYLSMQNKLEAESLKGQVLVMKENVAANTYVKAEDVEEKQAQIKMPTLSQPE